MDKKIVYRGDVWYANLPMVRGSSVQGGVRPVLVYQTNKINNHSPVVNALAITSQIKRKDLGYHVNLPWIAGLPKMSMVLAEQVFTLDQSKLFNFRCKVPDNVMQEVDRARRLVTRKADGHKQSRHRRRKSRYSSSDLWKTKAKVKEE